MDPDCRLPHEARITTQMRWREPAEVWMFCAGHAAVWAGFFTQARLYWLSIEPDGAYQEELPLD